MMPSHPAYELSLYIEGLMGKVDASERSDISFREHFREHCLEQFKIQIDVVVPLKARCHRQSPRGQVTGVGPRHWDDDGSVRPKQGVCNAHHWASWAEIPFVVNLVTRLEAQEQRAETLFV